MTMRKRKKFQLDHLGLTVAMSRNLSPELGERWKNWEYPVFRQAPIEYSSIELQKQTLLRLNFMSLSDLTLCRIY